MSTEEVYGSDTVAEYLRPYGLTVRTMSGDTSTANAAAATLGTQAGAIVKSLVFFADSRPLLALVSGDRRVDTQSLATAARSASIRLAKPSQVIAITGYAVGGVPPVAHRQPLPVFMDRTLLDFRTLYAAAGSSIDIFEVTPHMLQSLTSAQVADFAT